MSSPLFWLVENRVIYNNYSGCMSKQFMRERVAELREWVMRCDQQVHIITDTRGATQYPTDLRFMVSLAQEAPPPNQGYAVTIISNPLVRFFAELVDSRTPHRVRTVRDLQEAAIFLNNEDFTLPPLPYHVPEMLLQELPELYPQ